MINKIKNSFFQIKASKEGSTVVKNFGYLTLLQVAGYIFPLITLPYLARVIGTTGFGKIAFAAAIISWVQTVTDWGFNYTATRDVAQKKGNKDEISQIFSNVLWARFFLSICSLVCLIVAIQLIPSFRDNALIILITYVMIPGHILFPEWFFQAIEKMKYITVYNLVIKLIFTLLVFVFIHNQNDYIYQPIFSSLGYIICGLLSMWTIVKKWGYRICKPNSALIIKTIKNSTDVFINNLMPNLYNSFSVMILGSVCGSTANGIFEGGNKFISIAHQFEMVLSRAFFPFLSRRTDRHYLFALINMGSGCLVAFILFFVAPIVVDNLLAPEFHESTTVLRILAISMVFMMLSNTYGTNYLIIIHKEHTLRNITMTCSIIGMTISYPLITTYSYIGAAITVLVSRVLLGTSIFFAARHYKRNI